MSQWFMLTLVGQDQPGIVAKITTTLYTAGCNLGEASMLRLGGNFTIMLMVHHPNYSFNISELIKPTAEELQLHFHFDPIEGQLHDHQSAEIRISVHGADRAGIVAQVTTVLAEIGFNILNLESDVGGNQQHPFYIMHIEGTTIQGIETIKRVLNQLISTRLPDLYVQVEPIDTSIM
ncbi:MAG: amino acid-binding protein [Beggiatoa sp. IS2]|nr:MAG: amino acid-binding protein [Beggiatoa sp. IS2]